MKTLIRAVLVTVGASFSISPCICSAVECPSLQQARELYKSSEPQAAINALSCRVGEKPGDFDAIRLLADIKWWQGNTYDAEALAQSVLNVHDLNDPEMEIHLTNIARRFRVGADGDFFSGNGTTYSSGSEGQASIDYRDEYKNHYQLGFSHLEHVIAGSAFVDNNVRGGFVWSGGEKSYVELSAGYSLTALFSPQWLFGVEAHYIFVDESDVSLGLQKNIYTTENTSLVTLSWSRPVLERLVPSIRLYSLMSSDVMLSILASLKWTMIPSTYAKGFFAGGRTLEAPGLEDSFYSAGLELGHFFRSDLSFQLNAGYYNSDLRNEIRVGVGGTWLL